MNNVKENKKRMSLKKMLIVLGTVAFGCVGAVFSYLQITGGNPAVGMVVAALTVGVSVSMLVAMFNKSDAFNPNIFLESAFR